MDPMRRAPDNSMQRTALRAAVDAGRQAACCVLRNMKHLHHHKSVRHKGLRKLYETGSTSGIQASHAKRRRIQLAAMTTAQAVEDMDIPGFRLHPLKGPMRGRWSISVNGNWRLPFEFGEGNAYVLNCEDYH